MKNVSITRLTNITVVVLTVLLCSCFGSRIGTKSGRQLLTGDKVLTVRNSTVKPLKILYTGCGGMAIVSGTNALLTDPYYTGHNGFRVATGIKPAPKNAMRVFDSIKQKFGNVTFHSVLLSHAHYDHMEDLPWVLQNNAAPSTATVMGSPTAFSVIAPFLNGRHFINLNDSLYRQAPNGDKRSHWIKLPGNMRLLPIEADHAPHLLSLHFMRCKNWRKNKDCNSSVKHAGCDKRTCASKWKEGTTYAFLLDVISNNGADTLRLFIQTSSCNPPYGFPPAYELGKKSVDVAILCAASFQWINNYPESILSLLKPKQTLLVHYENFFRDFYRKQNPRGVPGTNLKKFTRRLRKHYGVKSNAELGSYLLMPKPLSVLTIN